MASRFRCRSRPGFTLLDLMIVVVIIGILAAIVTPALVKQRAKVDETAARTTYNMVRKALDMHFQKHHNWPALIDAGLFFPPEPVSMPRGYQLKYYPDTGGLELVTLPPDQAGGAPSVVIGED